MQSKGLIKFFLVLLLIVSGLQFFYMVPTSRVEKEADNYAQEATSSIADENKRTRAMRTERANYLDSISDETIFKIPLIREYTYSDLKSQQLALGLDLKGGMSAVLQVDLKDLLIALANDSKDRTFREALANADIAQKSSQSDYVTLFADEFRKIADGKKLAKIFNRAPAIGEEINLETSDGDVVRLIRSKADETVKLTYNLLNQRLDKLGVAQPNISLDEGRDMIIVEMPGIDNPERARKLLQQTANLEFWNTYRVNDPGILGAFAEADKVLKAQLGDSLDTSNEVKFDTIYEYEYDDLGNTIDSVETITEKTPELFASQGPLTSILTLNGQGTQQIGLTVMGLAQKNKKNVINTYLARPSVKNLFPQNSEFVWSQQPYVDYETKAKSDMYELYLIKVPNTGKPPLQGDVVVKADQSPDPTTGEATVSLRMNSKGAKTWGEMTTKAYNDGQREIAITLDDEVVSAPGVRAAITGGSSSISGNFTVQEANDLANILEVGKLPAKTRIIQESTVGPTLGQKNIISSRNALIVGFGLVLLFMILYYGGAGIVSIIALLLNIVFIFGTLASFGTVLTLPGIAGIVLTIGMAVDANVIIFERVREELRAGKSLLASIADGFRNSYSAIIDANVTTLLTAAVLAYFGLGPVKGFAVVLIIGVLSSLFTAVLVGKLMINGYTKDGKNLTFWTGWSKNMFANMQIDWLGKRKIAYILSGVIILAGAISMVTRGFDLGVDFKGGYSYNVEFAQDQNIDNIKTGLAEVFGTAPVVKAVDTENTYNIVTDFGIDNLEDNASEMVLAKLHEGIQALTGSGVSLDDFSNEDAVGVAHVTSSAKVGPTIADDIKTNSLFAGVFALILIFLYIFIRFSKWQYSLGAVTALFHDSLLVLGVFSLLWGIVPFSLEIDQAFIAAILTVIGYSINDTVVLFDRIREDFGIYTNKSKDEVINGAINSTFSRTIITSLTTLLMVGVLFVFGGGSIRGFAFALLIGVLVGTYSSIFVATPIVRDLTDDLKITKKVTTRAKKSFSSAAKAAK